MPATTLRFTQAQVGRSWVGALALALLIGGADAAWSADPTAGKWSLTYHLTTKPGHETFAVAGQTNVQKAYVTHACQPGFTVNPDGTFAFTTNETGCNRNEHDNTSPGGDVHSLGKWQVYLKVSEGKVDGEVVRLTLDQAFGNGEIRGEFPAFKSQAIITTSPDSDTTTQVTTTPYATNTHQIAKTPGGYTPKSGWGSQKWELNKTSKEGSTTIYSAARDKQLGGGLLVVETVEVQRKSGPDLEVAFEGKGESSVNVDGLLDVNVLVTNVGDEASEAAELTITFKGYRLLTSELLDAGTAIGIGRTIESTNQSVTFRVGRLEPGEFTNAIARFRTSADRSDVILYGILAIILDGGDMKNECAVHADVTSYRDTNDANNHATNSITIRRNTPRKK